MIETNENLLQILVLLASRGELRGFYADIPDEVYQDPRCPGWRSSSLKLVASRSYAHFQHAAAEPRKESEPLRLGRLFHQFMEFGGCPGLPAAEEKQFSRMYDAMRAHPEASRLHANAEREMTAWGVDPTTGLLMRARYDLWHQNQPGWDGPPFSDLKSSRDASDDSFLRDARYKYRYGFSMAHYLRVAESAAGLNLAGRVPKIIALEKTAPYGVRVLALDTRTLLNETAHLDRALGRVWRATKGDGWTGYDLEETSKI